MKKTTYYTVANKLCKPGDTVSHGGYRRGACHKHKTIDAAIECEKRRAPWYCDHDIVRVEDGSVAYVHGGKLRDKLKADRRREAAALLTPVP